MYNISLYIHVMNKAIAYIRVSTEEQSNHGVGLEAQLERIKAWAAFNEVEITEVFTDAGISGKRANNRPALQAALKAVRKQKCQLVVYSLSRLSRNVRDTRGIADGLERAGADLVSLSEQLDTSTAAGQMCFKMMSVMAEYEAKALAERTTNAMAHLRNQGRRISKRIPYGHNCEDGTTLTDNREEQEVIGEMSRLKDNGMSYAAIAKWLTSQLIPTKNGRK